MKKADESLWRFNKKFRYDFWKHFETFSVQESESILVAVSGGVDSMCLLNLLYDLSFLKDSPEYPNFNLAIAHVNFSLRGKDSDADEQLVRKWAKEHGVKIYVKKFDTRYYAKRHSLSIEMAARDLRYSWFYKLMTDHKYNYLAVAHNANDNAETLLLNLVRGTGIKGLQGIREKRDVFRHDYTFGYSVIRPLMIFQRSEIEEYAQKNGIKYRTDKTNRLSEFARNRIRNEVMPHLEKINPAVIRILNRDIKYFTMTCDIVNEMAQKKMKELCVNADGVSGVDYLGFRKEYMVTAMPIVSLKEERYHKYWMYEILQNYGFNITQIDDISVLMEAMIEQEHSRFVKKDELDSGLILSDGNVAGAKNGFSTKIFESDDYVLAAERGYLKIYYKSVLDNIPDRKLERFSDFYEFKYGRITIHLRIAENNAGISQSEKGLLLDADKIPDQLVCRKLKEGDKFSPYGLNGTKSVADYLNGKKMDTLFKGVVPIIASGSKIICLPGIEIDDHYKVTPATRKVLIVDVI